MTNMSRITIAFILTVGQSAAYRTAKLTYNIQVFSGLKNKRKEWESKTALRKKGDSRREPDRGSSKFYV